MVGEDAIDLATLAGVAFGDLPVELSASEVFVDGIERSRALFQAAMDGGATIYGVNTGYGYACGNRVAPEHVHELGDKPIRSHGVGTGAILGEAEVRATMLCRLLCLAGGYSGVSLGLLRRLAAFLNHGITPVVPSQGSVGASGDLCPMSFSMGTIAARSALRATRMTGGVVAAHLLIAAQAAELRGALATRPALAALVADVRALAPPLVQDRRLDTDLECVTDALLDGALWGAGGP